MSGIGFGKPAKKPAEQPVEPVHSPALDAAALMRPQPLPQDEQREAEVRRVVAAQTDTIRQTPLMAGRKRKDMGITQQIMMRLPVAEHYRFVECSKVKAMTYGELIIWLMDRAGIAPDGR